MPQPKISLHVKAMKGTLRAAHINGVVPLTEPPPPPARLSQAARQEWQSLAAVLVARGSLTAGDLRGLELLCVVLETEAEARAAVARDGFTVATSDGGEKASPAIKVMEAARNQAAALLRDFGLVPKTRAAVETAAPMDGADDPAARYFT
jgi:P27 family predicted phage terminase small subunit